MFLLCVSDFANLVPVLKSRGPCSYRGAQNIHSRARDQNQLLWDCWCVQVVMMILELLLSGGIRPKWCIIRIRITCRDVVTLSTRIWGGAPGTGLFKGLKNSHGHSHPCRSVSRSPLPTPSVTSPLARGARAGGEPHPQSLKCFSDLSPVNRPC